MLALIDDLDFADAPHARVDPSLAAAGSALLEALLPGHADAVTGAGRQAVMAHGAALAGAPNSAALWALIEAGCLRADADDIRLVATGPRGLVVVPPAAWTNASVPDPARVRALHARGATIAFQRLDRHLPALAEAAGALSAATGHPVQCSAYLSPGGTQGLDVHHDTHDVIVLQLEGQKCFRLYRPIVLDPIPRIDLTAEQAAGATEMARADLRPGTSLYLPRGTPHAAVAGPDHSLHLTIGILVQSWAAMVEPLARELYYLEPLRRAIPPGEIFAPSDLRADAEQAVEQLILWLRHFGAERLAALAAERFVRSFEERPDWPDRPAEPAALFERAADGAPVVLYPGRARIRLSEETS